MRIFSVRFRLSAAFFLWRCFSVPFFSASAMAACLWLATMAKKFLEHNYRDRGSRVVFHCGLAENTAAGCDIAAEYVKAGCKLRKESMQGFR